MSAFSKYAARSEQATSTVRRQSVRSLTIATNARYPDEDGYPISGDMLAVIKRGKDSQAQRRRRLMVKVLS